MADVTISSLPATALVEANAVVAADSADGTATEKVTLGQIAALSAYTLPTATVSVKGGVKIGSGVTVDGNGVISVSTSYASSSHTHVIADVDGLQAALNGKQSAGSYAAESHTHSWSEIVSGVPTTLSGYGITDAVDSSDSRLTNARTPTDGSVTDAKIASGGLSASVLNGTAIAPWAANTSYDKGDLVSYLGVAYRRSASGTTGASFSTTGWHQTTPSVNVVDTPTTISANQNNYSLSSTADIVRISASAARTITGFVAGANGRPVLLINVGSFAITLAHQSASSDAANRVICRDSANYIVDAGASALLIYDSVDSRWRQV